MTRALRNLAASLIALAVLFPSTVRADALDDAFASLPNVPVPTRIRFIEKNHDAWYARWTVLDSAKSTIDCTYFHVSPDFIGEAFLAKLLERARAGVKIRLLVDQRGSLGLVWSPMAREYLPALARFPNVQVRIYNAFRKELADLPSSILATIAGTHAKLLIVDGEWLVAGGRNMSNHWFTDLADDPVSYHDADVLARGTGIGQQAKKAFEDEFNALSNLLVKPLGEKAFRRACEHLDRARRTCENLMAGLVVPGNESGELELFASMTRLAEFSPFDDRPTDPVVLVGKHSAANPRNPITDSVLKLIGAAKTEVSIGHAYMVLTERIKAALAAASRRGVQIRFVTNSPESNANWLTQARFVKEWMAYMRDIPTLRIVALAKGRKLHSKVIVLDEKIAVVGSYNIDPMSETINAEDAAIVRAPEFAGSLITWLDRVAVEGIEYKVRRHPDGSVSQEVGPSDHVKKATMAILKVIGWMDFLRPLI